MSSNFSDKPSRAAKAKGQRPAEVLRSQKQPRSAKPKLEPSSAPPRPTQIETVTLASGETRSVMIEATNDKEWNDLAALAEGAIVLSLDQKDITHRAIAAIAALHVAHEDDWKPYCERRGMKWPKEVKSPHRPACMWVLNQAKAKTGENPTSKASMIAGCIDEYWEIQRPNGMNPHDIPAWLDRSGGYTKVYRDRLERLRDPNAKIAERYGRYLNLPPQEQRDIPDWLNGFAGEVVISALIDRNTGKLEYRSVWQPSGCSFWYSRLDKFIAARPDGKTVEPVHATGRDDVDGKAGQGKRRKSEDAVEMSAADAFDSAESIENQIDSPQPDTPPATKPGASKPSNAFDPDPGVTHDETQSDCNDLAKNWQRRAEPQNAEPIILVERTARAADGPLVCNLARGCRYSGCRGQGRCLDQRVRGANEHHAPRAENAGAS